ncbi:hypothetical protein ACFLUA_03775, partial [Chloroflexota bacterium]
MAKLNKTTGISLLLIFLFAALRYERVHAQDLTPTPPTPLSEVEAPADFSYTQPVNLSRSGAASQARIVAGPEGSLQAFWIDQFDGLMSAFFDTKTWSDPVSSPIPPQIRRGEPEPMSEIPNFISDPFGRVHAFFYGAEDKTTKMKSLLYSQSLIGENQWSTPQVLAESAIAYDVVISPGGDLSIAYMRTLHSDTAPAGVYIKRFQVEEATWSTFVFVYASVYYRLLDEENAWVRITDGGDGDLHMAWDDPFLESALYTYSPDGGITWSTPEPLGGGDTTSLHPRLTALSQVALRNWETADGQCTLIQQEFEPSVPLSAQTAITSTQTSPLQWSDPTYIFPNLSNCPAGDKFLLSNVGVSNAASAAYNALLLWLWGQGTTNLSLSTWEPESGVWTQPVDTNITFQDSGKDEQIVLDDLHAAFDNGRLAIVGVQTDFGEIWVTSTLTGALDMTLTEPSPWGPAQLLSNLDQAAKGNIKIGTSAITMDTDGKAHMIWSGASSTKGGGSSLTYSSWDGKDLSQPVEIFTSDAGMFYRQAFLFADPFGSLHLTWITSPGGEILYSKTTVNQAGASGGWLPAGTLPKEGIASWPQLAMDASGTLYLLYSISINENRGLYLMTSNNSGETWSQPIRVFDAVSAGWDLVDHPTLAVTPDGALHTAWVKGSTDGSAPPQGIYYASSIDGGLTWSAPLKVAEPEGDWPKLVSFNRQLQLFYSKLADQSVWQRWLTYEGNAENPQGWGTPVNVPSWSNVNAPFGLTVSSNSGSTEDPAGALHLVGVDIPTGSLLYSAWNGERWSQTETYEPGYPSMGLNYQTTAQTDLTVSAATRLAGGRLGIVWLLNSINHEGNDGTPDGGTLVPMLIFTDRQIPSIEISSVSPITAPVKVGTPQPTPEPTHQPTPTIA